MFELIFMMLLLKIPIVYLCGVVWYAIKAEPEPEEPAIVPAELRPGPLPHHHASRIRRLRGGRPHSRPTRRPYGPSVASARAGRRR